VHYVEQRKITHTDIKISHFSDTDTGHRRLYMCVYMKIRLDREICLAN